MRLAAAGCCAFLVVACGLDLLGEVSDDAGGSEASVIDGSAGDAFIDDGTVADSANADGSADAIATDGFTIDSPASPARKKSITFDNTKVAGTVTSFPVWIDLVDPQIAARAQVDGHDIFFTQSDGTALPHEIQKWDHVAGHLSAWVRIPQLVSASPTTIFVRYGDPTGAATPAPATVFSSSFAAVWHLEDALTTATIVDATGTHAGTGVTLTTAQQVGAKLGGGVAFTGGAGEISFTNPLSGNGPHTFSLWVSQATTSDDDALIVLGNATCGQSRWFHSRFGSATAAVGFYCNDWTNPGFNVQGAGWTLLHWVFEGSNNVSRIYRDGALVAGPFTQTGTAIATAGTGGHLGNAPAGWGANMGAHATVDEVRIASVARPVEWIATEHANQSSPATFYAVGAEQLAP